MQAQLGACALDPGCQATAYIHAVPLVLLHVSMTQRGLQHAVPAAGFHNLDMPVISYLLVGELAVQRCSGVVVHGRWAGVV